jgi:hypothetical protein
MPKPVPKKPKKKAEKLSTITNRLDALTSRIVRLRDRRCVVCGSTENLQCGHYLSRVFVNVRWDLRNCNCQCARCNMAHEYNVWPYTTWMLQEYGAGVLTMLSAMAQSSKKMTRSERLEIETLLKAELAIQEARQ